MTLSDLNVIAEKRRSKMASYSKTPEITGVKYYFSAEGDDCNDGRSPDSPFRSLDKLNSLSLNPGDGVLFRRGDVFRGHIVASSGVSYAAYGTGPKPELRGWKYGLESEKLWRNCENSSNLWELTELIPDCGTLVFNHGEKHSYKHIPSYINGRFVCRDDPDVVFDPLIHLGNDLDIVWFFDGVLTESPSKGESFPVPVTGRKCLGKLILRCDKGNPGLLFDSIEPLTFGHMFEIGDSSDVHIDGLAIKYIGTHAIGAVGKCVHGLTVTNCEIGWIGGCIQFYSGNDPNYPAGRRGSVTRYGNGVEIYGGCDEYTVSDCHVYQIYDAGITHQISTNGTEYHLNNIVYRNNLIEYCTYGIEYFLDKTRDTVYDRNSLIDNCLIENNIIRFSGYGWGNQRPDKSTPAAVKGWDHNNTARHFCVRNNVFDRSAVRLIHMVADGESDCAEMNGNTYIQYRGNVLCRFGGKDSGIIELTADDDISSAIRHCLKDKTGAGSRVVIPFYKPERQ